MKFTAVLVLASAIGVQCQTSTAAASSVSRAPTSSASRPTSVIATATGNRTSSTVRSTTTRLAGAGQNAVAPGVGLAAILALGALV